MGVGVGVRVLGEEGGVGLFMWWVEEMSMWTSYVMSVVYYCNPAFRARC